MLDTSNASMFPHRPSLGVHDFHLPRIDVNSLRGFIAKLYANAQHNRNHYHKLAASTDCSRRGNWPTTIYANGLSSLKKLEN